MVLVLMAANTINAQGCSDAGFCTIDSFKPNNQKEDSASAPKNQVKVGASYGDADRGIIAIGSYVEYNRSLSKRWGLDLKLTALSQSGNDISVFGLSDVFVNANYQAAKNLKFTLGGKIPLTDGNRTKDGLPLPMDYQSSLGTFDLLLGIGYQIVGVQLVAAIQQPLTQNNNQFLAETYDPMSPLVGWQSTNNYQRAGDMLLRISYPFNIGEKLKITASLLPIYHFANDKYTDAFGVEKEIANSEGLTLNWNAYVDLMANKNSTLQFNLGSPIIIRKARPDGLTRSLIMTLEYRIRF
ncbi:MAG: hypothetical protein CL840_02110 [Crocinitomicaceae bacterium]|nr:hypothetical protein [Crocinitomicaceae bacterium]